MRIGYFDSYDTMPATAPIKRAVEIAKVALEKQGYELVKIQFSLEDIKEGGIIYTGLVLSNYVAPVLERIVSNYDNTLPSYKYSIILLRGGYIIRSLFMFLMRITGNNRLADGVSKCKNLTPEENLDLLRR